MQLQQIRIEYLDGRTQDVTVLPVTHVAFEREFSVAFTQAFSVNTPMHMEHMMWLAWHASRSGINFDAWLESVKGLEVLEDESVDPTHQAPSDSA